MRKSDQSKPLKNIGMERGDTIQLTNLDQPDCQLTLTEGHCRMDIETAGWMGADLFFKREKHVTTALKEAVKAGREAGWSVFVRRVARYKYQVAYRHTAYYSVGKKMGRRLIPND